MSSNLIGPTRVLFLSIPLQSLLMERSSLIVIAAGLAAAAGLALISPYLSLMALIVAVVVLMVLAIGRDTRDLPDLQVALAEDARAIELRNRGNAPALGIRVALVPTGAEFEIASLAPDAVHELPLAEQMAEVKAIVSFQNGAGQKFRRSALLSALHPENDPLRPAFGIFGWK